jgi:hypothetical protein
LIGHYAVVLATELHTGSERDFRGYISSKASRRDKRLIWFLGDGKEWCISVSKLREWHIEAEDYDGVAGSSEHDCPPLTFDI